MRPMGSESRVQAAQMTLQSRKFREIGRRTVRMASHRAEHAAGADFLGDKSRTDS
jgi:hypothetical protein